jgi:pyruvate kinase
MARRAVRKTKVIATIGPACADPDTLAGMIRAGMNVARLNLSHGSYESHRQHIALIRSVSDELGANVAVMLDTKGVEIRTGRLESGAAQVETGSSFSLYTDGRIGDERGVSVSYAELPDEVKAGSKVLLDDGVISLEVSGVEGRSIRCRVLRGGRLADRRGVNLPGTSLGMPALTEENRADLLFAVENEAEYIAASFVRSGDDLREIREHVREAGGETIRIVAKIESAEGVDQLDAIVAEANGIMVARGDLGVEIPVEEVPMVQKRIIRTTVMNGKPVITATQMLDSMQRNPTPTRAEVSDVANAIFDGTSAVMLSGETAVGRHPLEAVKTIAALALRAEASLKDYGHLQHILPEPSNVITDAVSQAAITMATHLQAAAIVALTETGFTARSISKYRPSCPNLGVTRWSHVVRKLAMNWGVTAVHCEGASNEHMVDCGIERAREYGIVEPGDLVVATAGMHGEIGSTNLIRVARVE